MAGLKHLGFILTLATWLQEGCHAALGLYATGRQYLPEAADKVVQSAEDASVTVFNLFLAPIVPKAHDAATSWLEWIDDKVRPGPTAVGCVHGMRCSWKLWKQTLPRQAHLPVPVAQVAGGFVLCFWARGADGVDGVPGFFQREMAWPFIGCPKCRSAVFCRGEANLTLTQSCAL